MKINVCALFYYIFKIQKKLSKIIRNRGAIRTPKKNKRRIKGGENENKNRNKIREVDNKDKKGG